MILEGKHGFISSGTNQRPSPSSKSSGLSLRSRLENSLKCLGQMVEVNMIHMSFQNFVSSMASRDISLPDTLHSRMELLNGRTGPSWTWPIACCHTRSCQMSIGLKLLDAKSTFSTDHPQWLSRTRFLKKNGAEWRLVLHISEFLVLFVLRIYLMNSK